MSEFYKKKPSRSLKGCIIFVIDHSYSMTEGFAGTPRSKAVAMATAINRLVSEVISKGEKGDEEPLDYFDVGVIAYTTDKEGTPIINSGFQGALADRDLVALPELSANPLVIEKRKRKEDDGAGGLIDVEFDFPVWYQAPSPDDMAGTPMCAAMEYVHNIASQWCLDHPKSFPPIVIHLTDGESSDGDPEMPSEALRSLATEDGNLLLFNCHLSGSKEDGILFPASESQVPDDFGKLLFRMSSILPDTMRTMAEVNGYNAPSGARGMAFNADGAKMIALINVGTVIGDKPQLR